MRVIYNSFIPFKGFMAINLFGVVFARKDCGRVPKITLRHEMIHTAQMRELLYLFFYILYLVEWIVMLLKHRDFMKAYENISFEKEAFRNEHDGDYLKRRRPFSQWRTK